MKPIIAIAALASNRYSPKGSIVLCVTIHCVTAKSYIRKLFESQHNRNAIVAKYKTIHQNQDSPSEGSISNDFHPKHSIQQYTMNTNALDASPYFMRSMTNLKTLISISFTFLAI